MRDIFTRAVREAILILVVSVAVSLVVNHVREDGISLIADSEAFRIPTDARFMSTADAASLFEAGNAFFIDARTRDLFMIEHIEGALSVPSAAGSVDSLAWLIPVDPSMICYSSEQANRQAGVLADMLLEFGFKQVYLLNDGIEGWKDKGFPTSKSHVGEVGD